MAYTYQPYPRMIYKGEANTIIANYGEEVAALRDGWGLTPGFVGPPVVFPPKIEPVLVMPPTIQPTSDPDVPVPSPPRRGTRKPV